MHLVLPIILAWLTGVLMVIAFFMSVADEYNDYDEEDKNE